MAAKCVELKPEKNLEFDFSRTEQYEVFLEVRNTTKQSVSFKVKTTAPRAYLVRPSKDLLLPGASSKVQILLQPNAPRDSPHRFLIQATTHDKKEDLGKDEWTAVPKDAVYEQRLSVVEVSGGAPASQDLQAKYDNLVGVASKLEKEVKALKEAKSGGGSGSGGFAFWQILIVLFVAILAMKAQTIIAMLPPDMQKQVNQLMSKR